MKTIEIMPFIASKKASDLDKEKIEKVYEYTCNYLSVLQEEDELKNKKNYPIDYLTLKR